MQDASPAHPSGNMRQDPEARVTAASLHAPHPGFGRLAAGFGILATGIRFQDAD